MSVVIIGAGQTGIQAASALRNNGYNHSITLISDEDKFPYQRPPLSKEYLRGEQQENTLLFRPADYYEKSGIAFKKGVQATAINRNQKTVKLSNNEEINYEHLVLATGARNREFPFGQEMIHYLRTIDDANLLAEKATEGAHAVIIGGGFIGLELAASLKAKGLLVHVVERSNQLMGRVLSPVMSKVFYKVHHDKGVKVRLNTSLEEYLEREGIKLSNGEELNPNLLIAGIGVLPNTELADAAGLEIDNGIKVNEYLQTSDSAIYAGGDCAQYYNPYAEAEVRLESVQNAADQGDTIAANIMGKQQAYNKVPWFWTIQYHLKLQMAGISSGYDHYILRGEPESEKFSVFYFKKEKLIAVDSLNKPLDHMHSRKLLAAGVTPTRKQIEDESFKLKELLS